MALSLSLSLKEKDRERERGATPQLNEYINMAVTEGGGGQLSRAKPITTPPPSAIYDKMKMEKCLS